jgi:hypothetical protein
VFKQRERLKGKKKRQKGCEEKVPEGKIPG